MMLLMSFVQTIGVLYYFYLLLLSFYSDQYYSDFLGAKLLLGALQEQSSRLSGPRSRGIDDNNCF